MIRTIIVAVGDNGVIGKDNDLVWHMPADLAHFKNTTKNHWVLMGRLSYESVGKPLPKRTNVVISRRSDYHIDGAHVVSSLKAALDLAEAANQEEAFILGGAQIYKLALDEGLVDRMIITEVKGTFEGDAFFPAWDKSQWVETERKEHPADEMNPYPYAFVYYNRR